ncbi:MAG TPA: hypothetical protein VFO77_09175 [Actinoplanes sp.]|nr:hypothetical protein [Actinoplanes sp.]
MTTDIDYAPTGTAPAQLSADSDPEPDERDTVLGFTTADDPEPAAHRLLGISLSATLLALVGLVVGGHGVVTIVSGHTPGDWYGSALVGTGLACLTLLSAALLSIHRRAMPWLMLITTAGVLTANILMTRTL